MVFELFTLKSDIWWCNPSQVNKITISVASQYSIRSFLDVGLWDFFSFCAVFIFHWQKFCLKVSVEL